MTQEDCIAFLQWALPRIGYRWLGFRKVRSQVCKRVRRRIRELGLSGFNAYRAHLGQEASEWAVLDSYCRITISRFYRDRSVFLTLAAVVLPEIAHRAFRERREASCWSAGCASGEEAYTLRLFWDMQMAHVYSGLRFNVVGTDVDVSVIARAMVGCYDPGCLRELPRELAARCFEQRDGKLCVKPVYRHDIHFQQQDVRREMPAGPFDLILCRNLVLTYFDLPLQTRLMRRIATHIRSQGYLVIGMHETLPDAVSGFQTLAECTQVLRWSG